MSEQNRTVTVEVDFELHGGAEPESEVQRITWEVLDTAWKLLREGAVRVVLAEVRAQLAEQGLPTLPDDEAMFRLARESDDPDAPVSYLDLAPNKGDGPAVDLAGQGLQGAFQLLADQVFAEAADGLGFSIE